MTKYEEMIKEDEILISPPLCCFSQFSRRKEKWKSSSLSVPSTTTITSDYKH